MELIMTKSLKHTIRSIREEDRNNNPLLGYMFSLVEDNQINNELFISKDYNYLTLRGNSEFSFLPAGKEHLTNDDGTWSRKNRVSTTIGRFIRKFVDIEAFNKHAYAVGLSTITDKMVEDFVIKLGSRNLSIENFRIEDVIRIVKGQDIAYWYHEDNYDMSGSLGNSCMRYNHCSDYFDIYTQNPKQVSMLCMVVEDVLHGRCILWNDGTNTYYDRIYYNNEYTNSIIESYCLDQGFLPVSRLKKIDLDHSDFKSYPYMDNMYILDVDDDTLYNGETDCCGSGYRTLRDTGGGYEEEDPTVYSDWHGDSIPENDAVWCDCVDSYVRSGDTVMYYDSYSGRNSAPIGWDGICYVSSRNEYHILENCVEDRDGDMQHVDDVQCLSERHYDSEFTTEDVVEDYCGDYILDDDAVRLCEKYYGNTNNPTMWAHTDEVTVLDDGTAILTEDCVTDEHGNQQHKYEVNDEVVHNTQD